MAKEKYVYGCDICGAEKDWDEEIAWISSSFGVCQECYEKIPFGIRLKISEERIDDEVRAWLDEHCWDSKVNIKK